MNEGSLDIGAPRRVIFRNGKQLLLLQQNHQ